MKIICCRARADLAECRLAIAEARLSTAAAGSSVAEFSYSQHAHHARNSQAGRRGSDGGSGASLCDISGDGVDSSAIAALSTASLDTPPLIEIRNVSVAHEERTLAARCVTARAMGAEAAHAAVAAAVRELEYAQARHTHPPTHPLTH